MLMAGMMAMPAAGQAPPSQDAAMAQSAPIDNLLSRADDGVARRDWKLAIDSLQRVIEANEATPVEVEPGRYESSRLQAQRKLGRMPDAGLSAYRVLYDGVAAGLLERGRADHDPAALRRIVGQYLMTSYGDDAALLLAAWRLDSGDAYESLDLLRLVDDVCVDADVAPQKVAALRAGALGRLRLCADARAEVAGLIHGRTEADRDTTKAALLAFAADCDAGAWADDALSRWPSMGGGGDNAGLMPSIEPSLIGDLPWRMALPDAQAQDWRAYLESQDDETTLPALHAVFSDGRLFVRGLRRCAAIDASSFELLWSSEKPVETIAERHIGGVQIIGAGRVQMYRDFTRDEELVHDAVACSLSVCGEQVLMVERGDGDYFDADGVAIRPMGNAALRQRQVQQMRRQLQQRQMRRQMGVSDDAVAPSAGRLVSYDARTGQRRWQAGDGALLGTPLTERTENHSIPGGANGNNLLDVHAESLLRLRSADFLAPPVEASGLLWAPILAHGDLSLAALSPEDGRLVHEVVICTPFVGSVARNHALWPAVSGGVIYVQTGQGVVAAVRADNASLIWATRYSRSALSWSRDLYEARHWLSSPVVAVGDVILVAPTDADVLIALDRYDGQIRWQANRGDGRYLIGAQSDHVFVAGRTITCRDLQTGETVWMTPTPRQTGRAAISGSVIFVPILDGLLRIDANTGDVVGSDPMPPGHSAPGNLLAVSDGLISVDNHEIRKYPDLDRAYGRTVAAHHDDPTNAKTATRLAWMELLRGEPADALDALQFIGELPESGALSVGGDDAALALHLRIEALVAMAMSDQASPDDSIAYLEQAAAEATLAEDALQVGATLAMQLVRAGRAAEAYRHLWSLSLSEAADAMIAVSPMHRLSARAWLESHLRRIETMLSPAELSALQSRADRLLADAVEKLSGAGPVDACVHALSKLAYGGAPGGADTAAWMALAGWEARRGGYEAAEQYYLAVIRRSLEGPASVAARVGLADLYSGAGQGLLLDASRVLDEAVGEEIASTLQREAIAILDGMDHLELQRRRASASPGAFRIMEGSDAVVPLFTAGERLLRLRGETWPDALADCVLVQEAAELVHCISPGRGEPVWSAELRVAGRTRLQEFVEPLPNGVSLAEPIVVDGQTAVALGRDGLHAFGLVTGRRLWSVPALPPDAGDDGPAIRRVVPLDAGEGVVAYAPRRGALNLVRALDGHLVWSRGDAPADVSDVRVVEGRVATVSSDGTDVRVFRAADGRQVAALVFSESAHVGTPIGPVFRSGYVCGPDGDGVTSYALSDGSMRWRVAVPEGVTSVFALGDDRIGIGGHSGNLRVADAATGEIVFELRGLAMCRSGVFAGVEQSGMLVIGGMQATAPRAPTLTGVDLATGHVRWARDDLAPVAEPWFLHVADGVVPAVTTAGVSSDVGRAGRAERVDDVLTMIDVRTGTDVGSFVVPAEVELDEEAANAGAVGARTAREANRGPAVMTVQREIVDVAARADCLLVETGNVIFKIATAPRHGIGVDGPAS